MRLLQNVAYKVSYWWKARRKSKKDIDAAHKETLIVIEMAEKESIKAFQINGEHCEYVDCCDLATVSIEEKLLCPQHAKKMISWLLENSSAT